MKKPFLILATLYFGIQAFCQNPVVIFAQPYGQSISDPKFESRDSEYLAISKVQTSDAYTLINFVFSNTSNRPQEILLKGQNYYILANGERYDIIDFKGIQRGEITVVPKGRRHPFHIRFEPIPASVSKFDLIDVNKLF